MTTPLTTVTTMDTLSKSEDSGSAKVFAPSVGRNKEILLQTLQPKLQILRTRLSLDDNIPSGLIEIASGSGEHAAALAMNTKLLHILPIEPDSTIIESIKAWSEEDGADIEISSQGSSVLPALNIAIEAVNKDTVPKEFTFPIAFLCVNMIHISPYSCTVELFRAADDLLPKGGQVFTYGPYKENGSMVQSNCDFDESLKKRNSEWGIRDVKQVTETAESKGFFLEEKISMPANNLMLIFTKS